MAATKTAHVTEVPSPRSTRIITEASKTEHERRIFLERKLASTRPMILINFL